MQTNIKMKREERNQVKAKSARKEKTFKKDRKKNKSIQSSGF